MAIKKLGVTIAFIGIGNVASQVCVYTYVHTYV